METTKQTCHYCGEEKEDCYNGFMAITIPDERMEELIDKWGRVDWWENLERTDLTDEEKLELDAMTTYDQALNTIGRGVMCKECFEKEMELLNKYYPNE